MNHDVSLFVHELLMHDPIYLDTATNGVDSQAEIIEVAVLDSDGSTLIDTLVKPVSPIPWQVQQIHGIDNDMVRDAPTFSEVWKYELRDLLQKQRPLIMFNSAFEMRLLSQTAEKQDLFAEKPEKTYCAMLMYAEYRGDWDKIREAFVWHRLHDAITQCDILFEPDLPWRRAKTDCLATYLLVKHMAADREVEEERIVEW